MTESGSDSRDGGAASARQADDRFSADNADLRASLNDLAALVAGTLGLPDLLNRVAVFAARAIPGADGAGVTLLRIGANSAATDGHHHEEQEEAYVVIGGSGRIKLDDEVVELRQFDVVRVAPEVVRAFEAGPDGLEVIAVGGRKPEGGDGVRDPDRWPTE